MNHRISPPIIEEKIANEHMFGCVEMNLWNMYREHGSTALQSALSPNNFDLISLGFDFLIFNYSATNAKQLWTMFWTELELSRVRPCSGARAQERNGEWSVVNEWEWNESCIPKISILFVIGCDEGEVWWGRGRHWRRSQYNLPNVMICVCVFAENFILFIHF